MTALCLATTAMLMAFAAAADARQSRDTRAPAPAGTARIAGRVVTDESQPKPVRRARVTLAAAYIPMGRLAVTHDDGTFTFEGLAAGRYTVSAAKDGYVTASLGAQRPGRRGVPLPLREGESREVTVALPRGAVITGTVLGPSGLPEPGVTVSALISRYLPIAGERVPERAGDPSVTDDRGVYRIFGLPPGDYRVVATSRPRGAPLDDVQVLSEAEVRRALADVRATAAGSTPGGTAPAPHAPSTVLPRRRVSFAPVYFPGTTVVSDATLVPLRTGEERTGIDITMDAVPMARVEGSVTATQPGIQSIGVMLVSEESRAVEYGSTRQSRTVGADGTFVFPSVPPGTYTLTAQATSRSSTPGARSAHFTASTSVHVQGEDVAGLNLTLESALTVSGQVVFEGANPPGPDLSKLRVPMPIGLGVNSVVPLAPPQFDSSGRFTIEGLPATPFRIIGNIQGLRTPVGRWWLKSITIDGRELLDRPFQVRQSAANAVVTFSDRASTVTGVVSDSGRLPAEGVHVVAFSTDDSTWFVNSRRVAAATADAEGRYTIRNLPGGEYYIATTYDLSQGEWFDPVALKGLVEQAARFRLREYESKTLDLAAR